MIFGHQVNVIRQNSKQKTGRGLCTFYSLLFRFLPDILESSSGGHDSLMLLGIATVMPQKHFGSVYLLEITIVKESGKIKLKAHLKKGFLQMFGTSNIFVSIFCSSFPK